jgi:hypothetical protein
MQPPGDGDGSFASVLDVRRLPQAQERRHSDFVAWRVPDEEHHVRAELAVMQVPPATGESVDVVFSPHGANQPRPGIRSARVLGAI